MKSLESTLKKLLVHASPAGNSKDFPVLKAEDIHKAGYLTNRSTRAQFGSGSAPGDLIGGGSPRWKQRAFYYYLKDLYGMIYGIPVVRLSIYQMVDGRRLGEWLREDYRLKHDFFFTLRGSSRETYSLEYVMLFGININKVSVN